MSTMSTVSEQTHWNPGNRTVAAIAAVVAAWLAVAGAAETLEVESELWADGPAVVQPGNDRENPSVDIDGSGRRIVAWGTFSGGAIRSDVYMRRFDARNQPLSDPVLVNTFDNDDQRYPRVAAQPSGAFLVVWQSDEVDNTLPGGPVRAWIRGQVFDSNASPVGPELVISSISTDLVIDVSVDAAALSNGDFAVVWESNQSIDGDNSSTTIQGRVVSAAGSLPGSQFRVNEPSTSGQRDPAVADLPGGGFAVVFAGPSSGTDSGTSIQGRLFNNAGTAIGSDFQVNTTTPFTQDDPDIASDGTGSLLVVWESPSATTSRTQIFARRLDAAGAPLASDFQIHPTNADDTQLAPRVGSPEPGRFLVAWYSDSGPGDDPDRGVQARLVAGQDSYIGAQFQVNDGRSLPQQEPDVAGWRSEVFVVYTDFNNPFAINDDGIVARGFTLCLFCDDLETADTGQWSSAVE